MPTDDLRHYAIEVKPIGSACNLRCEYCYYLGKNSPSPTPSPKREGSLGIMPDIVLERYIQENGAQWAENTAKSYRTCLNWIEPVLGGVDVDELRPYLVEAAYNVLVTRGGTHGYILKQNPQAQTAFNLWKQESAESLTSQLEKNEDLKDLVLNETPWVMDAERETEQKQRLADFFDENLMQNRLNSAITKLQKLQLADGSWTWWKDMPGSFSI